MQTPGVGKSNKLWKFNSPTDIQPNKQNLDMNGGLVKNPVTPVILHVSQANGTDSSAADGNPLNPFASEKYAYETVKGTGVYCVIICDAGTYTGNFTVDSADYLIIYGMTGYASKYTGTMTLDDGASVDIVDFYMIGCSIVAPASGQAYLLLWNGDFDEADITSTNALRLVVDFYDTKVTNYGSIATYTLSSYSNFYDEDNDRFTFNDEINLLGAHRITDVVDPSANQDVATKLYVDTHETTAEKVIVADIGVSTYDDLQDWLNNTFASGYVDGFDITDDLSGGVDVAAGQGYIRASTTAIEEVKSFDVSGSTNIAAGVGAGDIIDLTTNYIYVDYNSGTPIVKATVTQSDINGRNKIGLGSVFREGTDLHILQAGMNATEILRRVQARTNDVEGVIVHYTGMAVSDEGTQNIKVTAGGMYAGYTPVATAELDTSVTGTFEEYYNDGAWQENDRTQINITQYNNFGVGLVALTGNYYTNRWVYVDVDGHVLVVLGQGQYLKLADAEEEGLPTTGYGHIDDMAILVARITIKEGVVAFTQITSAFSNGFAASAVSVHNELSGLNGDSPYEHSDQGTSVADTPQFAGVDSTDDIELMDPGTSANSKVLRLIADNTGTQQIGEVIVAYGASPYFRFRVPLIATGVATDMLDLSEASLNPANAAVYPLDLGTSGNKYKDLHLSGSISVDGTVDGIDIAGLDSAVVKKALFDAHTILQATTDDTPAALTVAEQTIVGRITAGNITALTATEVRTLLNVEDGADVTDAVNIASSIVGVAAKTAPVAADTIGLIDSEASSVLKEVSVADLNQCDTVKGPGEAAVSTEGGNNVTIVNAAYDTTDKVTYSKLTVNATTNGGLVWEVDVPHFATGLVDIELIYKNDGTLTTGVYLAVIDSDGNQDDDTIGNEGTTATISTHKLSDKGALVGTYTNDTTIQVRALGSGLITEYCNLGAIRCKWAT